MHCPKCGQQQASDEIRYCSRCGFLLTGVSAVIANNGELPGGSAAEKKKDSPRKRGIKQGAFIFLLSFIIVPLFAMFHVATDTDPFLAVGALIVLVAGGLLRAIYALMFESGEPGEATLEEKMIAGSQNYLRKKPNAPELPASESIPASVYTAPGTGVWKDTNDLSTPGSVTDSTTKLLSNEKDAS
jgi:hypothetical protein